MLPIFTSSRVTSVQEISVLLWPVLILPDLRSDFPFRKMQSFRVLFFFFCLLSFGAGLGAEALRPEDSFVVESEEDCVEDSRNRGWQMYPFHSRKFIAPLIVDINGVSISNEFSGTEGVPISSKAGSKLIGGTSLLLFAIGLLESGPTLVDTNFLFTFTKTGEDERYGVDVAEKMGSCGVLGCK